MITPVLKSMSLKKCIGSKLLGTNNVIVYWKNALLKFAESVFLILFSKE